MSVTIPATASKFKVVDQDFGTTAAQALWQRAAQMVNFIAASMPVGSLMYFHATQSNLPFTPDTRYWQKCDGATITNTNSVLVGHATPNLVDHFVRHPAIGESAGSTGGSDTVNLVHNHTGETDFEDDRDDFQLDNGDERREANVHHHTISSSLGVVNIVPPYRALEIWMRIV